MGWQAANARQKVMLDAMTDKFRAIFELAYSVDVDGNFSDLGAGAKAAILKIREELAK